MESAKAWAKIEVYFKYWYTPKEKTSRYIFLYRLKVIRNSSYYGRMENYLFRVDSGYYGARVIKGYTRKKQESKNPSYLGYR